MLMSTIAAPTSTAIPAARASASGSRPKICTAKRRPSKLGHMRPSALAAPRVSASADRNSVNVRTAPSSSHTVRNGRSVTASIGASRAPGLSCTSPMRMGGRENSTALVAVLMFAVGAAPRAVAAKRRRPPPPRLKHSRRRRPRCCWRASSIPGAWPRAADASDHARAVEDIGPYEHARPDDPTSPLVNTNAHYWTALVGIAWNRDVDIDFDREPVDLDGDGRPDTHVTRHIHAKGGVLANPDALRPDAHARRSARPRRAHLGVDGRARPARGAAARRRAERRDRHDLLALPRRRARRRRRTWDWPGATSTTDSCWRPPPSSTTRTPRRPRTGARAAFRPGARCAPGCCSPGPGRQDLTGEFGLDVTVPGYHSARYAGTARVRQGTRGIVNPISVPGIMAAPGLALENWSGSEDASAPWLERLIALAGRPEPEVIETFGLPDGGSGRGPARAAVRPAQPRHARACSTIRFRACCGPTRSTARPRCRRRRRRRSPRCTPPRRCARSVQPNGDAGTCGRRNGTRRRRTPPRGAARSSPSGSWERSRTARSSSARRARTPPSKIDGPVLAPIDPTKPLDAKLAGALRRLPRGRAAGDACDRSPRTRRRSGGARTATSRTSPSRSGRPSPNPLPAERGEGEIVPIASLALEVRHGPGGGGGVLRGVPREAPRLRAGGVLVEPAVPVRRRRRRRCAGQPGRRSARRRHRHRAAARVRRPDHAAAVLARRRRHPRPGARRPRRPRPHRRRLGARRAARRAERERALSAQRLGPDAARAARTGRAPPGRPSRSAPPGSCSTRASPATATRATSSARRSAPPRSRTWSRFLETL